MIFIVNLARWWSDDSRELKSCPTDCQKKMLSTFFHLKSSILFTDAANPNTEATLSCSESETTLSVIEGAAILVQILVILFGYCFVVSIVAV